MKNKWQNISKIGRLLIGAFCLALLGGITFVTGIAAAFGRAGNWSDYLAKFGLLLLAGSGGIMLKAAIIGLTNSIRTRRFNWWLPIACIAAGLVLWGGWIVVNL